MINERRIIIAISIEFIICYDDFKYQVFMKKNLAILLFCVLVLGSIRQSSFAQYYYYPIDTPTATATPTPGAWYKLKNASLFKNGEINLTLGSITSFDADDDGTGYLVIGNPGVVTSSSNIAFFPSSFKTSLYEWKNPNYSFSSLSLVASFYDYVRARKTYEIASVGDVSENKIYVIKSDSLDLTNSTFPAASAPFILIIRNVADTDYGNLVIKENITSDNSGVVILAKNIAFEPVVTSVYGLFIADSVDIQGTTNGLKVVGNLISNTDVAIPERTDLSKPSLFVVVDPGQYISLLPLSVSKYDFRQTQ